MYFENVKRYLDTFSTKQVKIIIFEEWIKDVRFTIEKILMFLGIESTLEDFEHEIHNPYGVPRAEGAPRSGSGRPRAVSVALTAGRART